MPEEKTLKELLSIFMAQDIFCGAIAVYPQNLVTNKQQFIYVMSELKKEEFPERFREAIEGFDIYSGPYLPASDKADHVYWCLGFQGKDFGWIYAERGGRYVGEEYIVGQCYRERILAKLKLTAEELEWLQGVAERLALEGIKPQFTHQSS